jgi:RNA polymerase sigma-70 factor (ECF subfamily)
MLTTPPSLLERLRQSPEREAWEKFVDMYTPLLFAWAARLGLSGHDAADLVQDLFAVLVEKLPQFEYDSRKSFRAWLKTILLNRWRKQRRKQALENRTAADGAVSEVAEPADVPEFEEEEYRRYLARRALALMQAEFQPTTWKACWEFVVRDRPAAAVAADLGISVNAVYLAKSRVLRRLREELQGLLD